jgi:hypothetical protein
MATRIHTSNPHGYAVVRQSRRLTRHGSPLSSRRGAGQVQGAIGCIALDLRTPHEPSKQTQLRAAEASDCQRAKHPAAGGQHNQPNALSATGYHLDVKYRMSRTALCQLRYLNRLRNRGCGFAVVCRAFVPPGGLLMAGSQTMGRPTWTHTSLGATLAELEAWRASAALAEMKLNTWLRRAANEQAALEAALVRALVDESTEGSE